MRSVYEVNSLVFEYGFDLPSSTNSHRYQVPLKVVKTEYEVFPFISLVGVIGGTLGMFVGFSFLNTTEWLIAALPRLLKWIKQKWNQCKMEEH